MTANDELQLQLKRNQNIPFDKYEKNFEFIVNGKRYQTSRIVTDLLSPIICQLHD